MIYVIHYHWAHAILKAILDDELSFILRNINPSDPHGSLSRDIKHCPSTASFNKLRLARVLASQIHPFKRFGLKKNVKCVSTL